jgi:8-oxoguanine deaminase
VRGALGILTGLHGAGERAAGDIRIRDGRIAEIGDIAYAAGETTIDARNCVVYPGLISTHQHLFQSMLKGVPAGIGLPLEGWVREVLFRYWHRFDERALEVAATVGIAELLLSGTTTVTDHHLLYGEDDAGDGADVIFAVAERLGARLVLCRGGATLEAEVEGAGYHSTPFETFATMVRRVGTLAERYNDPGPAAMRRVVFAPNTPLWAVTPGELSAIAEAARAMGIMLHTHLSETTSSVAFCRERFRMLPVEWMGERGWLGRDVWLAHLTHLDDVELALLAQTGTGMAHCAQSNCRLGAGVAPALRFEALGGRVSLGVDGAASNESAGMLDELQGAFHIHRGLHGADAVRAEDVVRWATAGGADVLGLPDIGTIALGQVADLAIFSLEHPRYAGLHDPLIGPALGGGTGVLRALLAAGRPIVVDGAIPGLDLARLCADATDIVRMLKL